MKRKAEAKSKKITSKKFETIELQRIDFETVSELSAANQKFFYAVHFGATQQLVNVYNLFASTSSRLTPSNKAIVENALDLIERYIDVKIARMNEYLDSELDNARRDIKSSKRVKKSSKRKVASKSKKK